MSIQVDSGEIESYSDDNIPCTIGKNKVQNKLELVLIKLLNVFVKTALKQIKIIVIFSPVLT